MELQITEYAGHKSSTLAVNDGVFACDFKEPLIHQVVVAYMACGRQGSKAQKNRSDVSGGGKKPWRQKGTGRARAGTIRSPLWRTGGVTFAARPRDYSQKVNKQMYRVAMRSLLSELTRQQALHVVETFVMSEVKTKTLAEQLKTFAAKSLVLIVGDENKNLALSARNLPNVTVLTAAEVNPVSLLSAEKVIASIHAIKQLEERFA